ncbi:MobA/MobL family protein [Psychrilyobacter atlanticus]|uniref:MobA/MobL family protein n=1 Tax=Psychrilyobacter atlanticus TaxID=271091 RepID=UPI0003F83719|nr:MobA/MobL family protein [Psychrilyobacter atlanticus]
MAIYRLKAKNGSVGHGLPHAEYILREGKYSKGTKKEELVYKESGNMPSFGEKDPKEFWDAADVYEVNRRPYKEYEISLPNELALEENKQIVDEFVKKIIGKDYPYTYAIHNKTNNRGEGNVHVHLMFCERKFDGIEREKEIFFKRANTKSPEKGGAKKDRTWQKKEKLLKDRKLFADITNSYLEKAGLDERVSHLSLEKQMNQALAEGDIDKANLLLRDPIDIPGKILQKAEDTLNKWEKKSLKIHEENKLIKLKKLENYKKKSDINQMEKSELIEEYNKTKTKLQEDKLDKTALNFCSNGAYYKMVNRARTLRKDIRKKPTDLELKSELTQTINNLDYLKNDLKISDKYKAKYIQIKDAYEIKLEKCLSILDEKYNVSKSDLKELHPKEKIEEMDLNTYNNKITIDTSDYFTVQNRLEEINLYKETLNKQLNDTDMIYTEAVDNISGNKFSALNMYQNYLFKTDKEKKDQDKLRDEMKLFHSQLKDPNISQLINKESDRLTSNKSLEIKDLYKEEDILKGYLSSLKPPLQELLDERIVTDLIDYKAQYNVLKDEKNYLEHSIISNSFEKSNKQATADPIKKEKENSYNLDNKNWQLNRLNKVNFEIDLISKKIHVKELQVKENEDKIPWYKSENNIKSKVAFKVIDQEYDNIKKLKAIKENLNLKASDKNIDKLALNILTKGEYLKIEANKNKLKIEITRKEKEIRSLGMFKVLEKKNLKKSLNDLEIRLTKLNTKQQDITKDFSDETLGKVRKKVRKGFKNAKRNIDMQINYSNKKIEFTKTLKTTKKYVPGPSRSNNGLDLKKILENKNSNYGIKVSLRDKKDKDIVELER